MLATSDLIGEKDVDSKVTKLYEQFDIQLIEFNKQNNNDDILDNESLNIFKLIFV